MRERGAINFVPPEMPESSVHLSGPYIYIYEAIITLGMAECKLTQKKLRCLTHSHDMSINASILLAYSWKQ